MNGRQIRGTWVVGLVLTAVAWAAPQNKTAAGANQEKTAAPGQERAAVPGGELRILIHCHLQYVQID